MTFTDETGLLLSTELELLGDGSIRATWAEGPVWIVLGAALQRHQAAGSCNGAPRPKVTVYREGVGFTGTLGHHGEVIRCSRNNRRSRSTTTAKSPH